MATEILKGHKAIEFAEATGLVTVGEAIEIAKIDAGLVYVEVEYIVRHHNGQCAYGDWAPASDVRADLVETIAAEPFGVNGVVVVGGQKYAWARKPCL